VKIWTITTDNRNGHECRIYYTAAAADAAALEACRNDWPQDEGPCPDDWRAAMEIIEQGDGLMMWVEEHTITDHPDIAALIEDNDLMRGKMAADDGPAFVVSPNLQGHMDSVTDAYRKAAQDQATDDLEVDPEAYVAVSEDGDGAFVAAWLWVPESDAAKHLPPLSQETIQ
jgi:hypothetical protein